MMFPPLVSDQFNRAMEMADEFTWATVVGVDLAPIQPRFVQNIPTLWNITYDIMHIERSLQIAS